MGLTVVTTGPSFPLERDSILAAGCRTAQHPPMSTEHANAALPSDDGGDRSKPAASRYPLAPEVDPPTWLSAIYLRHARMAYAVALRIHADPVVAEQVVAGIFDELGAAPPHPALVETFGIVIRRTIVDHAARDATADRRP
jgi:hypothetical protein